MMLCVDFPWFLDSLEKKFVMCAGLGCGGCYSL